MYMLGVELESRTCLEAVGSGTPCLIEDAPHSASSQFALDDRFLFSSNGRDEMTERSITGLNTGRSFPV